MRACLRRMCMVPGPTADTTTHLLLFVFPSLLSSCSEADGFSLTCPSAVMSLACHRPTNHEAGPPRTTDPKRDSQIQSPFFLNCFFEPLSLLDCLSSFWLPSRFIRINYMTSPYMHHSACTLIDGFNLTYQRFSFFFLMPRTKLRPCLG